MNFHQIYSNFLLFLSVFFTFQLFAFIPITAHNIFLGKGVVYAGNFSNYFFETDYKVRIVLTSLKGDCDIYVAKGKSPPTVDVEGHQLQSVTCGLDVVDVPDNFGTEMTIGVYGHPSHEYSVYHLEVITYDEGEDIRVFENGSVDTNNKELLEEKSKLVEKLFFSGEDSSDEKNPFWGDYFENTLEIFIEVFAFILEGLLSVMF